MDPNEALKAIREMIANYNSEKGISGWDLEALVQNFAALDQWIASGGFLPEAWSKK